MAGAVTGLQSAMMGLVPSAVPTATPVAKLPSPFSSESLFAGYALLYIRRLTLRRRPQVGAAKTQASYSMPFLGDHLEDGRRLAHAINPDVEIYSST